MARKRDQKEYRAWLSMKSRCYAPSQANRGHYQEMELTVCDRWLESYENFLEDMGKCPSSEHSIDRIDNSLGYYPENCRWADWSTQSKNRGSFNIVVTHNDETMVLKDWARKLGINYSTLYFRVIRNKMPFEDAIKEDPFNKLHEFNGEKKTIKDWGIQFNLPIMTIVNRMWKHKWSLEKALTTPYVKRIKPVN